MKSLNKESFVKKARIIHGEKYNYDKFLYVSAKQKSIITCKKHGDFEQTPDHHIRGQGCKKCAGNEIKNKKYFIERSLKKHGNLYIYDKVKYVNRNVKVEIVCKKHGSFFQSPFNHYAGKGCEKCTGEITSKRCRKKFKEFLKEANDIHGNKYEYVEETYLTALRKMKVICKKHGVFEITPNKHLSLKRGCQSCSRESLSVNTWSYTKYDELCQKKYNGLSSIYLITCTGNSEYFYKIGVTATSIEERFSYGKLPYEYKEISKIEGKPVWCLKKENEIHKILNEYRVRPKISFSGSTECFSKLTPEVLDFFGVSYAA